MNRPYSINTPWGPSQDVYEHAHLAGVFYHETGGLGGIELSPEAQARLPDGYAQGNFLRSTQWHEGDIDAPKCLAALGLHADANKHIPDNWVKRYTT